MLLNGKTARLTFQPRNNQVLLERLVGSDTSEGGIAIPSRYVENPLLAKVLAMGPGKEVPAVHRKPSQTPDLERYEKIANIKVGDIVFFNLKKAVPFERDPNSRLCIIDADDILAVVTEAE